MTSRIRNLVRGFFRLKPIRYSSVPTRSAVIAATAVVLTQLADALSTYVGIEHGQATEANNAMASLMASTGYLGFFAVKLAAGAFLAWYTWRRPKAPYVVVLIYSTVTVWNFTVAFLVPSLLT